MNNRGLSFRTFITFELLHLLLSLGVALGFLFFQGYNPSERTWVEAFSLVFLSSHSALWFFHSFSPVDLAMAQFNSFLRAELVHILFVLAVSLGAFAAFHLIGNAQPFFEVFGMIFLFNHIMFWFDPSRQKGEG